MLSTTGSIDTPSDCRFLQLWAERYTPDWSILSRQISPLDSQLVEAASLGGRAKTALKVQQSLQIKAESAGIQTNERFAYLRNVVDLAEANRLAQYVWLVYQKALEIYQQQPPLSGSTLTAIAAVSLLETDEDSRDRLRKRAIAGLELPAIQQLALALEPVLLELQKQHLLSQNQRTIGFITTQFHFSTQSVLKRLTLVEQFLLGPYFKFVEEQVCIPWQRICLAAAKHRPGSPTLVMIERLLSATQSIASTVYHRATQLNPTHQSRRGGLENAGVAASVIRDLNMFQGYLILCVLEGSMASVEQELLPLCVTVFPSVEVKWTLIEQMVQLLIAEIQTHVPPESRRYLLPYTQVMQQLFSDLEVKV